MYTWETLYKMMSEYAKLTHREIELVIRTDGTFKAFAYYKGVMLCEWGSVGDMAEHLKKFVGGGIC